MQSFFSALQSVLAAFFGVQSENKRNADFKHHSPATIIVIAVMLFIIFVIAIYALVVWVLST
jgi:heme/copper-type cytochrome/quinol oxidase subunit 2